MVDTNLTHIYPVLDRSGSMTSHVQATCAGFDAFIAEQRGLPGRCLVTLAQFDNQYEIVYVDRDVNEVPPLELVPRGSTALLDAIGRTIVTAGDQLARLPEHQRPGSVVVPILTDGLENASREYTPLMIKSMIKGQTLNYNWLFTYIGANQDAILVGKGLGVDRAHTITYNQENTGAVFASLAANTATYRNARAAGESYQAAAAAAAYSAAQRSAAVR